MGTGFSIARASDPANRLARCNDVSIVDGFVKAGKVRIVVIAVVEISDSDAPSSKGIPALHFNYTVAGTANWNSVASKQISSFMYTVAAPAATASPCAAVAINAA